MNRGFAIGAISLALTTASATAAPTELENGFEGALRGCEQWILDPASWANDPGTFAERLGLGNKAGWVNSVDEAALPPQNLRVANHYLRINATIDAGFIIVVSDRIPFCHITGGGGSDMQPVVEAVLASDAFLSRWQKLDDQLQGEMASSIYQNRAAPHFSIIISRAQMPDQRRDRVQVVATALYELDD